LSLILPTALLLSFPSTTAGSLETSQSARTRSIVKRIDALLANEFSANQPGGVVMVAIKGKPLFRRAYGLADLELKIPMRPDSVLRIGSITKQFTAVAILKLVEQGKLTLVDDVRTYVPRLLPDGEKITIEQVLTHTSGLPNLVDLKDFEKLARQDYKVEELLALTKDQPNHFPPGQGFKYSDTGYILLGAVIERATGLSYGEYLETQIFRPLGMSDTYYGDDRRVIPRHARGYSFEGGKVINAGHISMSVPHAAGALVSTVDDLLLWDNALRSGLIVRKELLERGWQPRTLPDGTHSGYGFGWKICSFEGHRTIEHGGWINGFGSKAIRFPDDDLSVIVLVNNDGDRPDAGFIARRVSKLILTGSDELSERQLTAAQKESLVGRYRLSRDGILAIRERDGHLYYQRGSEPPERLVALSPTTLSFARGDRTFLFNFDFRQDGRAQRVRTTLSCEPVATGERFESAAPHWCISATLRFNDTCSLTTDTQVRIVQCH